MGSLSRAAIGASVLLALCLLIPSRTETAVANGDTRTLHLFHTHTGETIDATYRVDGHYDPAVLRQLNHFLRDWRNDDEISMDPRLFDAVWEAYRTAGATDRIQIYSAYRSPETNAMLRRRSRAVAEHSQHMLGKAMDTTMPGFPMSRIRDAGMKLQRGGVGWYPSANFVHLDVGGVRSWPRMPYDQLMSLFPDGKTVHIASNGQTLPGYEQARAELAQGGETDLPPSQSSGGFFAWLFGGGSTTGAAHEDEEDRRAVAAAPQAEQPAQPAVAEAQAPAAPAEAPGAVAPVPVQVASLDAAGLDAASVQAASADVAGLDPAGAASRNGASRDVAPIASEAVAVPLPLPPRRPADLVALQEIPLPPTRPTSLARLELASLRQTDDASHGQTMHGECGRDDIGGLITATASGVPMIRKSGLPSIITQGSPTGGHRRTPTQVLAFAASDADVIPEPAARPTGLMKPVGLRGARRHASTAEPSETRVAGGPRLTGLRRAAHLMAQASL